jgi:hypothetical protein
VNPTRELIENGFSDDKPDCLQPDSIANDPLSLIEARTDKTMDFRDPHKFWQRITSGAFVHHFHHNKIRVRVEYIKKYKNEAGKMETKTAGKVHGQAPKLFVITNYPDRNPIEKNKRLTIGDILRERIVREHFGIPMNEHSSPPWICLHDALMTCIIISQDYKLFYKGIRLIQAMISDKSFTPSISEILFWIGGSGGAPEDYGSRPQEFSQQMMGNKWRDIPWHKHSPSIPK